MDIKDKDLYYKEQKLGTIKDTLKDPFAGEQEIVIIKTGMNNYKAAPKKFLKPEGNRYTFQRNRTLIDEFPKMSMKDIENDDQLKRNLIDHYGEPQHWSTQEKIAEGEDTQYMGSSQVTNQTPNDNKTLKDEMDYDKLKHGKERQ